MSAAALEVAARPARQPTIVLTPADLAAIVRPYLPLGLDPFGAFALNRAGVSARRALEMMSAADSRLLDGPVEPGWANGHVALRLLGAATGTRPAAPASRDTRNVGGRTLDAALDALSDGTPGRDEWYLGWKATAGERGLLRRCGVPPQLAKDRQPRTSGQVPAILLPAAWWLGLWDDVVGDAGWAGNAGLASLLLHGPPPAKHDPALAEKTDGRFDLGEWAGEPPHHVSLIALAVLGGVSVVDASKVGEAWGRSAGVMSAGSPRGDRVALGACLLVATGSLPAALALASEGGKLKSLLWERWVGAVVAADGHADLAAALITSGREDDMPAWAALVSRGFQVDRVTMLASAGFAAAEALAPQIAALSVEDLLTLAGLRSLSLARTGGGGRARVLP